MEAEMFVADQFLAEIIETIADEPEVFIDLYDGNDRSPDPLCLSISAENLHAWMVKRLDGDTTDE